MGALAGNVARAVVDVSDSGMAALVSRRLDEFVLVRLKLTIGAYRETFELAAEVRRCAPSLGDGDLFRVGLRFVDPSAVFLACIRRLLFDRMRAPGPRPVRSA